MVALSRIGPDEYLALAPPDRWRRIAGLGPGWYDVIDYAGWAWLFSEFQVLLFNCRKRALHDFIAGTVVIHTAPAPAPDPDRLGILPLLDRR